ncbi:MAG: flagellar biosynthesis anti-sigma factor FlgM [Helicobacteraceae bacterium]|jgi:anti-sigma28 factor (negative regulator of flagellin synthesis)|nr:flagellar biosynthesis anti-sigma factor FlgM [Helicobacteraceae bacterium]
MLTPIAQNQVGSANVVVATKGDAKTQEVQKTQSKIEEIKEGLEQGTYKFNLEQTAQKVVEALI